MSNINKLKLLQAKADVIFAHITEIYDKSKRVSDENTRATESFLADIETIDETSAQFKAVVDEINLINLDMDVNFVPDFKMSMSLDAIISHIKFKKSKISKSVELVEIPNKGSPVKLPAIEIASFDGIQQNWPMFYESFKANIHQNKQLSQSQKMQYLMSKLSHNALHLTAGIIPTGENYNALWESLVQKYQDNRALGSYYIKNILEIKVVNNTASSLNAFIEKYSASIAALKQLKIENLSDFILLNCALRKLDSQTVQNFEMTVREKEIPSYKDLVDFVKGQVKILERIANNTSSPATWEKSTKNYHNTKTNNKTFKSFLTKTAKNNCLICFSDDHMQVYECTKFKNMSVKDRFNYIKAKNGCFNCLSYLHQSKDCKSMHNCKKCQKRHNSLLHFETSKSNVTESAVSNVTNGNAPVLENSSRNNPLSLCARVEVATQPRSAVSRVASNFKPNNTMPILLSTAEVFAFKNHNKKTLIRCLIDNASQNHLVTVSCCKKLNLPISPLHHSVIKGVGVSSRPIRGITNFSVESRISAHRYDIQALVVDHITDNLPTQHIDSSKMYYLMDVPLADDHWNVPNQIDLILGAQLFPFILLSGRINAPLPAPPLLQTTFGYIIMGQMPITNNESEISTLTCLSLSDGDLQTSLQKFFELEELPSTKFLSPEEKSCETYFQSTVSRNVEGRYSVALPFKEDPNNLGNSYAAAQRRFIALERKFNNLPSLRNNYNEVINDYITQGYLSEVPDGDEVNEGYYMPHHPVVREEKTTTKLRVVLDASAKSSSGLSLNDILYTGPNLQTDLFILLLQFRLFPVAITADIRQMYLQITVAQKHRKYERILYRFDSNQPIKTYQFDRLPFGLKSSPYLAMRTIHQLALDEKDNFPLASKVAQSQFYMDDLVCSVLDETSAKKLSHELIELFKSGKFDLVKWVSNSPAVLESLPGSHRAPVSLSEGGNNHLKVLGLSWDPCPDVFLFNTSQVDKKCTKRTILSMVARLFDVLGLVSPVILFAKLLIKELWLAKLDWDDSPPLAVSQRFLTLIEELPLLTNLKLPRHVGFLKDSIINIVAFCDASMNGYGCVIYVHSTDLAGNISVRLLCSKSKVSPTKITTLARLELCAALMMSKLIKIVYDTYSARIPIKDIYAFSDSTIALSWIHSSPHRWSIFVSNRVAQCQENLQPRHFYHVNGIENPSDCLSRGMLPSQLKAHKLWWNGPIWLQFPISTWPIKPFAPTNNEMLPEIKSTALAVIATIPPGFYDLTQNISRWDKLLRIVVYCLRFMRKLPRDAVIKVADLIAAEKVIIKTVQGVHFSEQIKEVKMSKVSKRLKRLSPFMDEDGILRIEGRLSMSDLPFEAKHPALLPKHDHVVDLIIDHYHQMHLHTGPGLLSSILRQRFWILSGRSVIRWRVSKCNKCFRVAPLHPTPKMGNLPTYRIQEAKAFVHTGVDYAGPLSITLQRKRGQRAQKAYLCIFVCLTTKAVHIELASDLSSDTFLASFKRFLARRGPVSYLYSDNGTNFIGAKAQLDELYKLILSSEYQRAINEELTKRRICWKLIPPHSPHFGGIWESNIKCFKTHLYRVVGGQLLTYEELLTVLIQIEALLNSRPLCVMSEDPYPEVLTPAHFLMSSPLQYLPASDIADDNRSLRNRKELLDSLVQSYWRKWRLEYLHTLQIRQKWCTPDNPITVGQIVLVGQDNAPPLSWPLGVITQVYPGSDGVVRVVLVKTKAGVFKRPVVKLYPLPTQ